MPHYPHMLMEDIEVWSRYLAQPVVPIKEVWYDVRVGMGIPVSGDASDLDRRIAAGIGKKRIDVVCKVGGGYWVVEVKPRASMLAVGQVLSYARLFQADYRPDGVVWPGIVCDAADDDLRGIYDDLGVLVVVNS